MAAQPRRMPNWAAFLLGVLTAVVVMAVSRVATHAWKAPSPVFALDLRLPTAPRLPDTPTLPPPPIPTPK